MKSLTLPCDFSGSIIPPLVLTSAANLSTRTRSWRGWKVFRRSPFWKISNSNYVTLFNVQFDKKKGLTARRLTARNMIVEENERITIPRTGMVNKGGQFQIFGGGVSDTRRMGRLPIRVFTIRLYFIEYFLYETGELFMMVISSYIRIHIQFDLYYRIDPNLMCALLNFFTFSRFLNFTEVLEISSDLFFEFHRSLDHLSLRW